MSCTLLARSLIRIVIAFAVFSASLVHSNPVRAELQVISKTTSTSLLVSFSASPEEIGKVPVSLSLALGRADLDPRTSARLSALGSPIKIEPMIRERVPENLLDKLSVLHPERLLHNFVEVTYISSDAAESQLETLRRESGVLSATRNSPVEPSYYPSWEPFYSSWWPQERDYQWGNIGLWTFLAWDITPGWGDVGVVDTGIATTHEEFVSAFAPQFAVDDAHFSGTEVWS